MKQLQHKLIYVCLEYPGVVAHFGGIGVSMRQEAHWFASQGYDVTVVCQTGEVAPGLYEDGGVKISVLGFSQIPKFRAFSDRLKVAEECKSLLADSLGIVICPDYSGPMWLKRFRQPLLVQLHGCATLNATQQGKRVSRLVTWFERRTIKLADAIQSCSRFTAVRTGELLRFGAKPLSTIHHPIDHRLFYPEPMDVKSREILFVGKFNALKGVFTLAQAIEEVFEEIGDARLLMVGADSLENGGSVQEQFMERIPARFHPRIELLGRRSRSEVAALMRRAGIVVFPSRIEAFPLVVLEAMSSGRPVVASACGGIPEIITQGVTGLLANPDDPATFARALITLLKNPETANLMGEAARCHIVESHSMDAVYAKTEKYHSDLCSRWESNNSRVGRESENGPDPATREIGAQ